MVNGLTFTIQVYLIHQSSLPFVTFTSSHGGGGSSFWSRLGFSVLAKDAQTHRWQVSGIETMADRSQDEPVSPLTHRCPRNTGSP